MSKIIDKIEKAQIKKNLPKIAIGDTVKVFSKIIEGSKERIQGFEGVVIKLHGTLARQRMTVRRIVQHIGVEKTFPLNSPRITNIEVKRQGHVRRAKLYYLRDRVGKKATRITSKEEKIQKV